MEDITSVVSVGSLALDDSGNVYVAFNTDSIPSEFWGANVITKNNLAKLGPQGELIWLVSSPNANWKELAMVDGYIVVAGYGPATGFSITQANSQIYQSTPAGAGQMGGLGIIITIDNNGQVVRHSHYGRLMVIDSFLFFIMQIFLVSKLQ